MPSPLAIVARALPDGWLAVLDGQCRLATGPADEAGLSPTLSPHLAEAEGLLCTLTERVDTELLARMPRLKVVSNMAVGVDNVDVAACTRRGIPVGNTPGVLTDATADLAMALLLSAARRLPEAARDAREGRWGIWSPTGWLGRELRGSVLGIVGMGKIGTAVATRAGAFGMTVLFTSRTPKPQLEEIHRRVELDELLAAADVVSLHVPLAADTRHLIDARALARMKPGSILVNTARGGVVDQDALLQAVVSGHLGGAALDVTDPEPLPPDSPLYARPEILVLPHIGSATTTTRRRMARLAAENLLAGLRGDPLPHCVNARDLRNSAPR